MNKCKIGFIGYGNMAKAIAASFKGKDYVQTITAYDVNPAAGNGVADMAASAADAIAASDHVFLSIKPQMAAEALSGCDFTGKIVISIMAGIRLDDVAALCKGAAKIVRVMPNLCARVGKAVNAYCGRGLTDEELADVAELLGSFGFAAAIDESFFDAITGLTGSSPAYTFRYAKDIVAVGVKQGLSFEQSRDLVLYCIKGCMDMMTSASSLDEMQTMIDNVCSKGGTTIEGIYKLDAGNFDDTVMSAIEAAIARSAELSRK